MKVSRVSTGPYRPRVRRMSVRDLQNLERVESRTQSVGTSKLL